MRSFLFLLLVSLTATFAHAQSFTPSSSGSGGDYLVAPSLFYLSSVRTRSSREETAYFSADLRLGYQIYPQLYAGINYQADQKNVESTGFTVESFNNTSKLKRNSIGASLTYVMDSVHFSFTYYVDSKLALSNTNGIGNTNYEYTGTGLQADVGYRFLIWGISLGPQLSYKSYTYSKLNIDGAGTNQITPKLEESNFEPSLIAYFFF